MAKLTVLTREYTVKRQSVTKRRKVNTKGTSNYYSFSEAAQRRHWSEDTVVEITINVEEVCKELAARAIHTKSGKSTTFHGLIKAKVKQRVEHDVRLEDVPLRDDYVIVEN